MGNQENIDPAKYKLDYVSQQVLFTKEFIKKLNLQGYERLLDLGCGRGYLTACLAQVLKGGQVAGIDNLASAVEFAKATYKPVSYPNLKFWQMDLLTFDLHGRFDRIVSNAMLHWVEDHTLLLGNVQRHLAPQGKIFFRLKGQGHAADLCMVMKKVAGQSDWQPHFQDFQFPVGFQGAADYEKWLPAYGFAAKRIELLSNKVFYQDVRAFQTWLQMTWFRIVDQMPLERQWLFWEAITTAYLEVCPLDRHGRVLINDVTLEVEAVGA